MKLLSSLLLLGAFASHASPKLTGRTGNPANSMFVRGRPVPLHFQASGLQPDRKLSLQINIFDQNDKLITTHELSLTADTAGKWAGSFDGPGNKYGFYRVRAKLSNGATLPKVGSRPAGCLTYAVLPDPKSRKLYGIENTFFGLHGNSSGDSNLMPWLGARWCSTGVYKTKSEVEQHIEQKRTSLWTNWKTYTYVPYRFTSNPYHFWTREQIEKHAWSRRTAIGPYTRFTDAEGKKLYIQANAKLAKYGLLYQGDNDVMRYQPLWEPDLIMTNAQIEEIYRAARQGLHSTDPNALVLGPCFHSIHASSVSKMEELFKLGFLDYIDEFTIHPYIRYPVEANGLVQNIRRLKGLIKKYSKGRGIKIRGNESGYSAINTSSQELVQMYGQVRATLILLGEGFASNEPFFGFDHDKKCVGDYGLTYNLMMPEKIWGTTQVAPRPVFPALAAASHILEGHKATCVIDFLGDSVLGYSYADPDNNCVIALWDFGGKNSKVNIPVGEDSIVVADIMGNRINIKTVNGSVKLQLSESPQYLIGVSPQLWGKHVVRKITLSAKEVNAVVGSAVKITGKLATAGMLQLDFNSALKLPAKTIKLDRPGSFEFVFQLPSTIPPDQYPVTVKLLRKGRIIEASAILLEVLPPVKIDNILTTFIGQTPALEIRLTNLTEHWEYGKIATRIPGYPAARKRKPFTLRPKATASITIPFDDFDISPFQEVMASIKITLNNNYQFSRQMKVNFLPAQYLQGVGINNDFSAWSKVKYHPVNNQVIRGNHYHHSPQDLNAVIGFGWNENYLLFDVRVDDDVFYQPFSCWRIWDGDSLQFGFAKQRITSKRSNELAERYDLAFSEINFALTTKGAEANRTFSFDKKHFPSGEISLSTCPRKISKITVNDKTLIHYRIAVPWQFLNLSKVKEGMNIYWAAMINDRDQPSPAQSDISALGVFSLKQSPPSNFGTITLTK